MGGFGPPFTSEDFMRKYAACWLYHKNFPKGKIFYDALSFDKALSEGWVEAPQAIVYEAPPEEIKDIPSNGKALAEKPKKGPGRAKAKK